MRPKNKLKKYHSLLACLPVLLRCSYAKACRQGLKVNKKVVRCVSSVHQAVYQLTKDLTLAC